MNAPFHTIGYDFMTSWLFGLILSGNELLVKEVISLIGPNILSPLYREFQKFSILKPESVPAFSMINTTISLLNPQNLEINSIPDCINAEVILKLLTIFHSGNGYTPVQFTDGIIILPYLYL